MLSKLTKNLLSTTKRITFRPYIQPLLNLPYRPTDLKLAPINYVNQRNFQSTAIQTQHNHQNIDQTTNPNHLSYSGEIDDKFISKIATIGPELTSIDLSGSYNITDEAIIALAQKCPELTHISLRECNITNTSIVTLAQKCPKLTRVGLSPHTFLHSGLSFNSPITDEAIIALAQKCPNIESIITPKHLALDMEQTRAKTTNYSAQLSVKHLHA